MNAAIILGVISSERALLWLEGDVGAMHALAENLRMRDDFRRLHPASQDDGVPPEGCDGPIYRLELDGVWAGSTDSMKPLDHAILQAPGVRACSGWTFAAADSRSVWRVVGFLALATTLVAALYLARHRWVRSWPAPRPATRWHMAMAGGIGVFLLLAVFQLVLGELTILWELESTRIVRSPHELNILATAVGIGILMPLTEEIAYRGWMMPLLEQAIGLRAAVVVGTVVFAASHVLTTAIDWAAYLAVSLSLTLLWARTRSLLACVVAHVLMNVWAVYFAG